MSWETDRTADVVVLTAIRLELDAALAVEAGAVPGTSWEVVDGPSGLPVAFRPFEGAGERPLRIAVAVSPDMGATAAVNTLLPLVEALRPRCIAMCGVCAGRRGKTQLGDVVAADRVYYHDTGKRRPDRVEQDLTTYKLRDDWKAALETFDPIARFRDQPWFQRRPIATEWRERRALLALRDGGDAPWDAVDPTLAADGWKAIVASLRKQGLLAATGRELTEAGRRAAADLLFESMGELPDLSPAASSLPFRLHVAPLASGTQVIEDEAIWGFVSQAMRKTLALEMEGAAIAELAHRQRQYALDAVVMKGVMDFADHGRDDHFKEFAARASAECLIAFLREQVRPQGQAGIDDLVTPGTSAPPDGDLAPSSLLEARHQLVPWYQASRVDVLSTLDEWADDGRRAVAVRLLHGEGGLGKTRLAIEWLRRRRARGEVAGFLVSEPGPRWLERLCGLGPPVTVVVDYAESRADLGALVERVAAHASAAGARRVRLLLLARNDGDWWAALPRRSGAVGQLLAGDAPLALSSLAVTRAEREEVFAQAAAAFAAWRRRAKAPGPPIDLDDARFGRVLYLHMAALAAVDGLDFDAASLMDQILDHEERFWITLARSPQAADLDVVLARQLLAAATLRGGLVSEAEARALCERLLERPRSREDDQLLALLRRIYEDGDRPGYLPALEPDLLGEGLVRRVAAPPRGAGPPADERWIERVFVAGDEPRRLETGFTVLGRASLRDEVSLGPWIRRMLATELAARAPVALAAAKAIAERSVLSTLGDQLADALEREGGPALATALDEAGLPYPTVSLQRVAIWCRRVLVDGVESGEERTTTRTRADRLVRYAVALRAAGRIEEALAQADKAVALLRALVGPDDVELHPDLAFALRAWGVLLGERGQPEAALQAVQEATALYEALCRRDPARFATDYTGSLTTLTSQLWALGRRGAALEAARVAADNFRALASAAPGQLDAERATSLNNLAIMLSELGQHEEALERHREAIELIRILAIAKPDERLPDLAMYLGNFGSELNRLGRNERALVATAEAVIHYRALIERNREAFEPDLARSLNTLGEILLRLGRHEEALAATGEAVVRYRSLVEGNPEAIRPHLAMVVNNLGTNFEALGDLESAYAATREAVELRRALAARYPAVYRKDLAASLNNLGLYLKLLGHAKAAIEPAREALAIRRELAATTPDASEPDLANSLNNVSANLAAIGANEEALAASREAVELFRRLAARDPERFEPELASSLVNLGNRLSSAGQRAEALGLLREGVELRRAHAHRYPEAFRPKLVGNLLNLGAALGADGQHQAAVDTSREAAELCRGLAEAKPEVFQPLLATALNNLAFWTTELGQPEEALANVDEALDLVWRLFERLPSAHASMVSSLLQQARELRVDLGAAIPTKLTERERTFEETVGRA